MATLSEKEVELMKTVLSNVEGGEGALLKMVDFEKVYPFTGHKDAIVSRTMFRRLLIKLNGGKEKPATSPKAPKAAAASKPQGVKKTTASGVKGTRGRKKKPVQDEVASEGDGGKSAEEGDKGAEKTAVVEEKSEEADAEPKGEEEE